MVSPALETAGAATQYYTPGAKSIIPGGFVWKEQLSTHGIPSNIDRGNADSRPTRDNVDELGSQVAWPHQLPGAWESDATDELLAHLEELRTSGDRYVYPGGTRPDEAAFRDARSFLTNLAPLKFIPKITLVADGEVNFLWESAEVYVDLGFHGDGEGGSYYAEEKRASRKYHCDSFPSEELPSEIVRLVCLD